MRIFKLFGHFILILILTALTQVGGLIWMISVLISIKFKKRKRNIFALLYLLFNLVIVPSIAKQFGREQLPWFNDNLKPRNWFYPLAFRNYVNPELYELLKESSSKSKIQITYLDANFPFFDGFPLLPHLSHNDGKKIDISFMYLDENGKPTGKKPSVSGYGVYSEADKNYTSNSCKSKGYWQYDFSKYLTFGTINTLKLDKEKTAALIHQFLSNTTTQKLFTEPHLKNSLGLKNEPKVRFHGCQAVRHDDHIHLQIN
jgi:hypothetical protein